MDDKNRNRQNQSDNDQSGRSSRGQQGDQQNVSNEQEQNPQQGAAGTTTKQEKWATNNKAILKKILAVVVLCIDSLLTILFIPGQKPGIIF